MTEVATSPTTEAAPVKITGRMVVQKHERADDGRVKVTIVEEPGRRPRRGEDEVTEGEVTLLTGWADAHFALPIGKTLIVEVRTPDAFGE